MLLLYVTVLYAVAATRRQLGILARLLAMGTNLGRLPVSVPVLYPNGKLLKYHTFLITNKPNAKC